MLTQAHLRGLKLFNSATIKALAIFKRMASDSKSDSKTAFSTFVTADAQACLETDISRYYLHLK